MDNASRIPAHFAEVLAWMMRENVRLIAPSGRRYRQAVQRSLRMVRRSRGSAEGRVAGK